MFKLTTFNQALERDYQAELASRKVQLTRVTMVVAFVLNLAFAGLDSLVIRSALEGALIIRLLIATIAVTGFALSWLPEYPRYYPVVAVLSFGGLGACVEALVYLADPNDLAYDMYFMGLIMVAVAIHALTYLPLVVTSLLSLAFICAYLVVALIEQNYMHNDTEAVLVTNLFFFVSMLIIAIIGQVIRDQYARENYLLRHSLSRDVELKEEARRRATWIAENDALTGVGNRLYFEQRASAKVVSAVAEGRFAFVLFIDLNEFKLINDRYGHDVGDRALKFVAEQIHASVQPDDLIARNGGDEFVACLVRDNPEPLRLVLTRIINLLGQGFRVRGETLSVGVSIGVACAPLDAVTLAETLTIADEAMYRVKHTRLSGYQFSSGIEKQVAQAANDPVERPSLLRRLIR